MTMRRLLTTGGTSQPILTTSRRPTSLIIEGITKVESEAAGAAASLGSGDQGTDHLDVGRTA